MDGIVKKTADGHELRYERRLRHPIAKVWAALTQPERMVEWLADADVELAPGGRVELRWLNTDDQGNHAVARGTITAFDPPRLIEYDTDIHGRIRCELQPEAGGCLLTFIVLFRGPDEYLPLVLAGWHIHLEHLEGALDGHKVDWPRWDADHRPRWQEHHDRYIVGLAGPKH